MAIQLKDIIIIRLAIAIIYTTYSIPIPFLPGMAESHQLHNWHIGIILASYAAGGYLNLLIMGKFMRFINKKFILYLGWVIATLATIGISYINLIESSVAFTALALLCRFLQGFCVQSCAAIFYSFILENTSEGGQQQKEIATINVFTTLGISFGPLIAGMLNKFVDVNVSLLICGLFVGFFFLFVLLIDLKFKNVEKNQKKPIQYSTLFANRNFTLTYFLCFVQICGVFVIISNFAQDLVQRFQLDPSSISLIYSALPISSVVCSAVNSYWSNQYVQRPFGYLLNVIIICLGVLLAAPQQDIGMPDDFWFVVAGLVLAGYGVNYFTIIIVPEYIYIMKQIFRDNLDDDTVALINDMASALFLQGFMIGELFGPIIGGVLSDLIGYQWSSRVYVIASFLIFFMYVLVGKQIFRRLVNFTLKDKHLLEDVYEDVQHDSMNSSGVIGVGLVGVLRSESRSSSKINSVNGSILSHEKYQQRQKTKLEIQNLASQKVHQGSIKDRLLDNQENL